MKKLFTLITLLVAIVTGAWADPITEKTWDFTAITSADITALGDNEAFTDDTSNKQIKNASEWTKNVYTYALEGSDGTDISVADGLTFGRNGSAISAGSFRYYYGDDKYIYFNNSKCAVKLPSIKAGQQVTITSKDYSGAVTLTNGNDDVAVNDGVITFTVKADGVVQVQFDSKMANLKSIVVSAPKAKHSVTYNLGEGTGTTPTHEDVAEGSSFTLATKAGITAPDGKAFIGWLCSVDDVTYAEGDSYIMTTTAPTFTAQYGTIEGSTIIRVTCGGGTSATVTGTIGGTADVNLSSNRKMDKNKFVGFTLDGDNSLQAGDIIEVNVTEAGQGGKFIFYNNTSASPEELYNTNVSPDEAKLYRFVIPAEMNGVKTIYLRRGGDDSGINEGFNPYIGYIGVYRPNVAAALSNTGGKDFGFATFCSSSNFTVSGGTAYKAELSGDAIVLKELTGIIPANEGVVIAGDKNATVAIEYTANDATAVTTGNILKGTTARVTTASLKSDASDKILGFFKSTSTFKQYTGEYFPAGLAYIRLNSGNIPNSLEMRFEEATSVKNIEAVTFKNEAKVGKKAFVNGQLVIITENGYVNALGQTVK